jgi:hypothetical protein
LDWKKEFEVKEGVIIMSNFELKKIISAIRTSASSLEQTADYCGHRNDPDQLDAYLFSLVDDLAGEDNFPEEVLNCRYCMDRLLKIQESVLAGENREIRPLKKILSQLKKSEWKQKFHIQIRLLKEAVELLACPGFTRSSIVPAMVRGEVKEPSQLFLNRDFDNFHLELYLFLEEDCTISIELKLSKHGENGKLPNRLRLLREEKLFESRELVDPEMTLEHLRQGVYNFEFSHGEENMGTFSLDLQ